MKKYSRRQKNEIHRPGNPGNPEQKQSGGFKTVYGRAGMYHDDHHGGLDAGKHDSGAVWSRGSRMEFLVYHGPGGRRDWMMDKKYELVKEETKQIYDITLYRIRALKNFGAVKAGDLGGYIQSENNLSHGGNAWVYDNAQVYGNAQVCGDAQVCGNARVCGDVKIQSDNDYIVLQGFGRGNRATTIMRTQDNRLWVVCGCFQGTLDEFAEQVKQTHGENKYAQEYKLCIELAKVHFGI